MKIEMYVLKTYLLYVVGHSQELAPYQKNILYGLTIVLIFENFWQWVSFTTAAHPKSPVLSCALGVEEAATATLARLLCCVWAWYIYDIV